MRVFVLAGLFAPAALAQPMPVPTDPCPEGAARADLVGGSVRAALFNNGKLVS